MFSALIAYYYKPDGLPVI